MNMNMKNGVEVQGQCGETVMVPDDARGWELYSGMAGVERAAAKITEVVVDAITNNTLYRAAVKVNGILNSYSRFGATDTEPRYHANRVLSAAFGVEDALYVSRPRTAIIPGLKMLKEHLAESEAKWERNNDDWDTLDGQEKDEAQELTGYVAGLKHAIKTLEEA